MRGKPYVYQAPKQRVLRLSVAAGSTTCDGCAWLQRHSGALCPVRACGGIAHEESFESCGLFGVVLGRGEQRYGAPQRAAVCLAAEDVLRPLDQIEGEYCARAVEEHGGHMGHAAKVLGVSALKLRWRLQRHQARMAAEKAVAQAAAQIAAQEATHGTR